MREAGSQSCRLSSGGRLDRQRPVAFTFNGRTYQGYAGDTLASALLANGVWLVGRSFKYHRPRGIVGAGAEEPNAIVEIGTGPYTSPNVCATQVELYDGLTAASVNCWPSVGVDLLGVNDRVSRLIPAGFYYKTFMWPRRGWMRYERFIRRSSGLGCAPSSPDLDRYEKMNAHCDVLVIGGGPAGVAAALAAGRSGARVILVDDQAEYGGYLLSRQQAGDEDPGVAWVQSAVAELAATNDVRLLLRSTAFGYHDHNFVTVLERVSGHLAPGSVAGPHQRLWRIRAKETVLATGAFERPLVFPNNDRPGVMLATAVSTYVNRFAVLPGRRAVVFTNNDSAYQTALDLSDAGVEVAAVVDARAKTTGPQPMQVRERGIDVLSGHVVVDVRGSKRVRQAVLSRLDASGERIESTSSKLDCDLVAVSGGWNPVIDLHCHSGAKARYDRAKACFVPGQSVQAERSAGACNGAFALRACLTEGLTAGAEAARAAGFHGGNTPVVTLAGEDPVVEPLQPMWIVPCQKPVSRVAKQFVDFQNDTTAADILMAAREGFQSIEHVKRYTLLGFGTDQGKLGNVNGIGILAKALFTELDAVGTTTFRPAYTPVPFGAIAGRDVRDLFDPVRKTALHRRHEETGAVFEDVGQWKRPRYFPESGESMDEAVRRECRTVRTSVGIFDASTLGKINVQGPDAAEFLSRVYTSDRTKLAVWRCSYGLMLGEDGMIMDDGVTSRLAPRHFLVTTTTGGAARVMGWLEQWLQTEWPHMKVYLTSVTDHWVTIAVAGPHSRTVMQQVCTDIDFATEAFPFMSHRRGTVAGVSARVFRISFSGELAYEINVPANYGRGVWEALIAAGRSYGITPYGTETMHVLRAEKGFVIVGQDTDGSLTPADVGMAWMIGKRKDFLGRRSLSRADTRREGRKQLVGLLTETPEEVLPEGGQIVENPRGATPLPMIGHVTSSYFSSNLSRSIALALVKAGQARIGQRVWVSSTGGRMAGAMITSPVFLDPEGARQRA